MPYLTEPENSKQPFVKNGGETGRLIHEFNWASTPLGPIETWPQALLVSVRTMLSSATPMAIGWGPSLIYLYNDAFIPVTGDNKHPHSLGLKITEAYIGLCHNFSLMYEQVFAGAAVEFNEVATPVYRNGEKEEAWFDFSCSPIWEDDEHIGGILFIARESTQKVKALNSEKKIKEDFKQVTGLRHKQLLESEELFRAMAERSDVMINTNTAEAVVDYVNKAWLNFLGEPDTESLSRNWENYLHPDEKENMLAGFQGAFEKQQNLTLEYRIRNKDGKYRWVLSKGAPRYDANGRFAGMVSSSIDITEKKRYQDDILQINKELARTVREIADSNRRLNTVNEELKETKQNLLDANKRLGESETKFRSLIENSPIAQQIFRGENLTFELVNDAMLQFLGKTPDIIGKTLFEGVPEIVGQPIVGLLQQVYRTGEPMEIKAIEVMLHRNGREEKGYYDVSYRALYNEGKITGVLGIAIDVTEQIVALKMLEKSEERMRMVMEAASMGSFTICIDDGTFTASPRLKEFFGYLPDEALSYEAAMHQVHPDYRKAVAKMGERAYTTGETFNMEYPIIGFRDEKIRWVHGVGTVQQDSDGKKYYTGVLHEITEQKQDEQRKNDFIGMVSHELKTPLTSLMALIQMTNRMLQKSENGFLAGAMDKAHYQARRMGNMINGFLDVSRLESGKLIINKEPFRLDALIRESIDEILLSTASHVIELNSCDAITVFADRDKMNSVITNLLSNAVKYSAEETRIIVSCRHDDSEVEVRVQDRGMGIKPEDMDKLFDRYYRVESAYTKNISGFGIGLYLSKEIIERHHGKIWVESEVDQGSTFYFTLPVLGIETSGVNAV